MSRDIHTMTDKQKVEYLREAGCTCGKPLLGYIPDVGPRCRLCNTQVVMVKRGGAW